MLGILDRSLLAVGTAAMSRPHSAIRAAKRVSVLILPAMQGAKWRFPKAFRPLVG